MKMGGAGRADVFYPRRTGREVETIGGLFCRLRNVWLPASFAIQSTDSNRTFDVFRTTGLVCGAEETVQTGNALFGLLLAVLVGMVVVGGIKRIGAFASRLVPGMVLLYGGTSLVIILLHADRILPSLSLILSDAFTGQAVAGGLWAW